MAQKRISLFAGHYGSGKTNIAVNYAIHLKKRGFPVVIADLDIVNPYFRTKDSEEELAGNGIELLCSDYAGSNLDIPALPPSMYRAVQDRSVYAVMDIGGDDAGAIALGRFAPFITEENDYEMLFVVNFFRPLTPTAQDAYEIMLEVEKASGLKFTGIVNNTNLGESTTAQDILDSEEKVAELCRISSLPLKMTAVKQELYCDLEGKIPDLFPLKLQKKII